MAVTVINATISAIATMKSAASNAATATAVDTAEVFTITPTRANDKLLLRFNNATAAATYSFAAGGNWAGKIVSGSITSSTSTYFQVETAKVKKDDGTILLSLYPATGKMLLGDHALTVELIETIL